MEDIFKDIEEYFHNRDTMNEDDFLDLIDEEFFSKYPDTVVTSGATKMVIIDPSLNYVIKIPFNQNRYCEEFCGAADGGDGMDYCKAETLIYNDATISGVENLFAKTELYTFLSDGTPVYVQDKCQTLADSTKTVSEAERKQIIKTISKHPDSPTVSPVWLLDVLKNYGQEMLDNLLNFLSLENINDLHASNVGYCCADNTPVIIDYAGYSERE